MADALSSFLNSKLFYVFGIPLSENPKKVQDALESAAGSYGGILSVSADTIGDFFLVETENDEVWNVLKRNRHRIQVDGKPCVIWFQDEALDNVQLTISSELISISRQDEYASRFLYKNVTVFPALQSGTYSRHESIVEAQNFIAAVKFDEELRKALFEQAESIWSSQLPPLDKSVDDPMAVSPLKTATWTIVRLASGDLSYSIEAGAGDIFKLNVDVLVFPADRTLRLHDASLEPALRKLIGDEFENRRREYLEQKKQLKDADVEVFQALTTGRIKRVMLTSVTEFADTELMFEAYRNCLKTGNEKDMFEKFAFALFLPEKLKESAEAAGRAIIETMSKDELKATVIKFVHKDAKIAKQFGNMVSNHCNIRFYGRLPSTPALKLSKIIINEIGKEDKAIALPPKTEADKVAAQWLEKIQVPEPDDKPRKSVRRPRLYGKRSLEEKRNRRARTLEQWEAIDTGFTHNFIRLLDEQFPPQDACQICHESISVYKNRERSTAWEETEVCLQCHGTSHIKCLDERGLGTCPTCVVKVVEETGHLEGGQIKIEVKNDGVAVPGYENSPGHIEITYSIPSGPLVGNHPHSGEWCFGIHRVVYLPNTADGQRIAEMLHVAFDRGLVFQIGKSLSLWNDNAMTWGCIPHKTRLDGGRANCGYPDPTYLSRVESVLKALGVPSSDFL